MDGDSKVAFTAAATELGLAQFLPQFEANGWDTFNDFAFATSDPQGRDPEAFDKEVVKPLLDIENVAENKKFLPKIRRLYAQAYTTASTAMEQLANPKGPTSGFT